METLHEKFLAACEYYAVLEEYEERIGQAKHDVDSVEKKYNRELTRVERGVGKSALKGNLIVIGAVIGTNIIIAIMVFVIAALFVNINDDFSYGLLLAAFYGAYPLCITEFIVCLIVCIKRTNRIRQKNIPVIKEARQKWMEENVGELQEYKKAYEDLLSGKEAFIYNHYKVIDFLPPDYREPYPVYYMESLVRNGRAESLKETINLFEELMHRERLEANSAQMLAQTENLQRQLAAWRVENNVHSIINHAQLSALNRNVRDIYDKFD